MQFLAKHQKNGNICCLPGILHHPINCNSSFTSLNHLLMAWVSGLTDPEEAGERCWGCGGATMARTDGLWCVQGVATLGIKATCVPKNLEPDTRDPPSLCTQNSPIQPLLSKQNQCTSLLAQDWPLEHEHFPICNIHTSTIPDSKEPNCFIIPIPSTPNSEVLQESIFDSPRLILR